MNRCGGSFFFFFYGCILHTTLTRFFSIPPGLVRVYRVVILMDGGRIETMQCGFWLCRYIPPDELEWQSKLVFRHDLESHYREVVITCYDLPASLKAIRWQDSMADHLA